MAADKTITATVDGTAGSNYFTSSTSLADFSKDYSSTSFTIDGVNYTRGLKMDSKGSVSFTTSSTFNTTVRFYAVRRKSTDSSAAMQIEDGKGGVTVMDVTPYDSVGDSGSISLAKGTQYTIRQKTSEQALILVKVTETE